MAVVTHDAQNDAAASPPATRHDLAGAAIHTTGLAKHYGRIVALSSLSMTVGRGEIFGFLGPNGAGKTTAVKLLLGLTRPTGGDGTVLGAPLGHRETRRRLGYLPELFRYQEWLTAREVLGFHCTLLGLPRARAVAEVDSALRTVGLASRSTDRVGTFSKGMQQRLGLGAALLGRPAMVLLDEPTSALDPVGRHDVREVIRALKQRGTTVFLNSHLLTEVELVCDRVAIVNQGRVLALGDLGTVLGGTTSVRLRVQGLAADALASLRSFGALSEEEGWLVLVGAGEEVVPDLVAAIVGLGGRVYAVEPRRQTLEERFLELLGAARDDSGGGTR